MKYRALRLLFLAGLTLVAMSACTPDTSNADPSLTVLTIGTADSGGTMYPVGSAIADVITTSDDNLKVNVSASSGSMMNVQGLSSGEIDLALVSGDIAYSALNGLDEYSQPVEGLRAIAAVYSSTSNWIAPAGAEVSHVNNLAGKRIGVGPLDSTTELSARIAIDALGLSGSGLTIDNSSLESSAQKVIDGELDAFHAFAGMPVIGLEELASAIPCRILRYSESEIDDILCQNPFYYREVIPANTYTGQLDRIVTFGVKCLLCVDESMDDDLVYALTQALWNSKDTLDGYHASMVAMQEDNFVCQELPIPLHDGAIQFYQGLNLMDKN